MKSYDCVIADQHQQSNRPVLQFYTREKAFQQKLETFNTEHDSRWFRWHTLIQ